MTVKTTKIQGGAEYAKVSDRLKEFRKDNPRGKIETIPLMQESGMVMFKATILKDKADEHSAEATGHALQTKSGIKDFEKLETVAVGRALALLGYGADGEIASSEEMEEFEEFKQEKFQEKILELSEQLQATTTIEEMKKVWASIDGDFKPQLENLKNELKKKYEGK